MIRAEAGCLETDEDMARSPKLPKSQKSSQLPQNAHDRLFRALIEDGDRAALLVRESLPEGILVQLDDAAPEYFPDTVVDEDLREHQTDGLFRFGLKDGRQAYVHVLFEHKSEQDPWTALQMARYMVRIWERHKDRKDAKPGVLPPVFPLLIYHGAGSWTAPTSVLDMIEAPPELEEFARSFSVTVRDLKHGETEDLSAGEELRAGLAALRHARNAEIDRNTLHLIFSGTRKGTRLERQVVLLIFSFSRMSWEELEAALRAARPRTWRKLMNPVAEKLIAQGEAKGIAIGEAKGIAIGEAKGKVNVLLRQVRRLFGDRLPRSTEARIRTASEAEVDGWLKAIFDARSPDDLFGAPQDD